MRGLTLNVSLISCVCLLEWDLGGFPAWLLAIEPPLKLRSSDPAYLRLVCFAMTLFVMMILFIYYTCDICGGDFKWWTRELHCVLLVISVVFIVLFFIYIYISFITAWIDHSVSPYFGLFYFFEVTCVYLLSSYIRRQLQDGLVFLCYHDSWRCFIWLSIRPWNGRLCFTNFLDWWWLIEVMQICLGLIMMEWLYEFF